MLFCFTYFPHRAQEIKAEPADNLPTRRVRAAIPKRKRKETECGGVAGEQEYEYFSVFWRRSSAFEPEVKLEEEVLPKRVSLKIKEQE